MNRQNTAKTGNLDATVRDLDRNLIRTRKQRDDLIKKVSEKVRPLQRAIDMLKKTVAMRDGEL